MKDKIERWLKDKRVRIRSVDKERIKSMINAAEMNAKVILNIKLSDETATVIFREIYESLRQLGDAYLWSLGYEPRDHDTSMETLSGIDIKDKLKLNFLDRYRKIRHDANYRGFIVSKSQAEEIIDLWKTCSKEIINKII